MSEQLVTILDQNADGKPTAVEHPPEPLSYRLNTRRQIAAAMAASAALQAGGTDEDAAKAAKAVWDKYRAEEKAKGLVALPEQEAVSLDPSAPRITNNPVATVSGPDDENRIYSRRYLEAVCRANEGDFSSYTLRQLLDIATLFKKEYMSFDQWMPLRKAIDQQK